LRHDTLRMLTEPVRILSEWRLWVVDGQIVTYSLYKAGSRVVHRHEIDDISLGVAGIDVDHALPEVQCIVIDLVAVDDT
ncbi:ATP-grasp domain-containing protein, partial [Rhizobium leguminosarum]|uniref:ATP-grasp domain-containing protein n=1 Tax=Rhizobium leguminosarum TaxID=384 RepID=UPI003F99C82E